MTFRKDISLFFNCIKTSSKNKVLLPSNLKYSKLKKILGILLKYGVIHRFGLINNLLFVDRNIYKFLDVFWFNKTKYLSNYKIQSLVSKFPDNIYVISTPIGILDSKDAIKFKLGGLVLFIIKTKKSIFL